MKDVLSILEQIQGQVTPVITRVFSLLGRQRLFRFVPGAEKLTNYTGSGGIPLTGAPGTVDGLTAALGAIFSLFGSIFGNLPGLNIWGFSR